MSVCSSCGARIFWAHTIAGKAMPIDADPVDTGNVLIDPDGKAIVLGKPQHTPNLLGENRYTSHFATCPDANQHRKD